MPLQKINSEIALFLHAAPVTTQVHTLSRFCWKLVFILHRKPKEANLSRGEFFGEANYTEAIPSRRFILRRIIRGESFALPFDYISQAYAF